MNRQLNERIALLALIDELADQLGEGWVADIEAREASATPPQFLLHMAIQDLDFYVFHDEATEPRLFNLECRWGPLPKDKAEGAMQNLLDLNAQVAVFGRQGFYMDDEGEVMFSESLGVAETPARDLGHRINARIQQIATWRSNHWLDADSVKALRLDPAQASPLRVAAIKSNSSLTS